MATEPTALFGPKNVTPTPMSSRLWWHSYTPQERKLSRGIDRVAGAMFTLKQLCVQCYSVLDGAEPLKDVTETDLNGQKKVFTGAKCRVCGSLNFHTSGYTRYLREKAKGV